MELCPETDEDQAEHLRVRIKEVASKAGKMLGVCYKLCQQVEQVNEAIDGQIEAIQHLQTLVLMGNFNHSNICWRSNTAGQKQSRRFLECRYLTPQSDRKDNEKRCSAEPHTPTQ